MVKGITGMYKGFMIVEHPEFVVKAYRYPEAYRVGVATYTATTRLAMNAIIDSDNAYGSISEEEYNELVVGDNEGNGKHIIKGGTLVLVVDRTGEQLSSMDISGWDMDAPGMYHELGKAVIEGLPNEAFVRVS